IFVALSPAKLKRDVAPFDVSSFTQALPKRVDEVCEPSRRTTAEISHRRYCRLLPAHGQRPRNRGAAKQRDEVASPHSSTSSARASSAGGTSSPSPLAVLRLITNSSFVANCTGRSTGFSPLRIRPV